MHRFLISILILAAFAGVPVLGAYDINIEPVSPAEGSQAFAAISGNTIVWSDHRSGNWDIYMFDITNSRAGAQPRL